MEEKLIYKGIIFDLDGTLYDKHKHIDEDTVQTV